MRIPTIETGLHVLIVQSFVIGTFASDARRQRNAQVAAAAILLVTLRLGS